jgi:septum site-determining protein MinC
VNNRNTSRRACELKGANFSLSVVSIYRFDLEEIAETLRPKVEAAPELLARAGVVLDFNAPQLEMPSADELTQLLERIRAIGLLPVALSGQPERVTALSQAVGLPILGKGRSLKAVEPEPEPEPPAAPEPVAAPAATARGGTMVVTTPVRAGQQIYARNKDLVVLGTVNAGSEVIADGSIHVYGRLSGRAIAGARGEADARIFARQFDAEIVSIAGTFRVIEDVEPEFKGAAVQAWLEGERLIIARLT